jgi:phospholipase D1/2
VHTKQALEALSKNISVFRHPDHNPSGREILSDFKGLFLHSHTLSELPQQSLEALYGLSDDVILFWAHHEKLCIVDGKMAFMGGLDACFGRWDTNQHPIT